VIGQAKRYARDYLNAENDLLSFVGTVLRKTHDVEDHLFIGEDLGAAGVRVLDDIGFPTVSKKVCSGPGIVVPEWNGVSAACNEIGNTLLILG
jgi:hypothetical protein